MATGSLGVRMNNYFMDENNDSRTSYLLAPELMFGVSKKLMLHAEGFLSNRKAGNFSWNGESLYAKYRFYSEDDVHSHFRLAAFGKLSSTNVPIVQEAIDLNGSNKGFESGLIATKLMNKVAISATASFLHIKEYNAVGYSMSAGKLLLPKEYTSYKQVNLNAMLELLGQYNSTVSKGFLDMAPSLQVIINSVARLDAGMRIKIAGDLVRTADNTYFLRFEYNFFNLFSK
jgi:hypothetical protein